MPLPTQPIKLTKSADNWTGTLQDEWVHAGGGDDVLDGGAGNDRLSGGTGNDRLYGGLGNDRLQGGAGDDQLYGGEGEDRLHGGIGNDLMDGGTGNDTSVFLGARADYQITRLADGSVEVKDLRATGGTGTDKLIDVEKLKFSDGLFDTDVLAPKPVGPTAGDDVLTGTAANDVVDGLAGNDMISGGAGNDRLTGGAGADKLYGGAGDDMLYVDGADTVIDGGDGVDALRALTAMSLDHRNVASVEHFLLTNETDTLDLSQVAISTPVGWGVGQAGVDNSLYGARSQGGASVTAGWGNDLIIGSSNGDTIIGDGNGSYYGGGGNDLLRGGGTLFGDDGDDWLIVERAATVSGGSGHDVFDIWFASGAGTVIGDFTKGEDLIKLSYGQKFQDLRIEADQTGTKIFASAQSVTPQLILVGINAADVTANMFLLT